MTFVLPVDDDVAAHQLPLVAGLAVRNAAAGLGGGDQVLLKWPNDLLYHDRKLAGLLCERVDNADLIGLGLNVNVDPATAPPHLRGRVASLAEAAGRALDLTDALSAVAAGLYRAASRQGGRGGQSFAAVLREYAAHHALVGRTVSVVAGAGGPPISGTCEGLDDMGRLLLRSRATLHRIISGHVVMRSTHG